MNWRIAIYFNWFSLYYICFCNLEQKVRILFIQNIALITYIDATGEQCGFIGFGLLTDDTFLVLRTN